MIEQLIKLAKEYCVEQTMEMNEDTSLALDMELSSMEILKFISEVEDMFDVHISERMLNRIDTLGDLCQIIEMQKKR